MTTKAELLRTIVFQCQECMGSEKARNHEYSQEHQNIVRECTAPECVLFPYRHGKDPAPARKGSPDMASIGRNPLYRQARKVRKSEMSLNS